MNAVTRNHEIEMMKGQIENFGHVVELQSPLCLNINQRHLHQVSRQDLHSFLSGYLAACEKKEGE